MSRRPYLPNAREILRDDYAERELDEGFFAADDDGWWQESEIAFSQVDALRTMRRDAE